MPLDASSSSATPTSPAPTCADARRGPAAQATSGAIAVRRDEAPGALAAAPRSRRRWTRERVEGRAEGRDGSPPRRCRPDLGVRRAASCAARASCSRRSLAVGVPATTSRCASHVPRPRPRGGRPEAEHRRAGAESSRRSLALERHPAARASERYTAQRKRPAPSASQWRRRVSIQRTSTTAMGLPRVAAA